MKAPRVCDHFPLSEELQKESLKFKELVKKSKQVLISSTLTSDGDSIGSQLGILVLLKALVPNLKIWIVNQTPVPKRYQFLSGTQNILSWEQWRALSQKPTFDLGIVCDGGIERTGDIQALFPHVPLHVLVDHHAVGSQAPYAARVLDVTASSSCELVYHLLEHWNIPLTSTMAEALYVGIVFDTGFFKHSLTTPRTHFVAASLISTGIDFPKICDQALLNRSWSAQQFLKLLMNNIQKSPCGRVVTSSGSLKEMAEVQMQDGDQEGMIDQLYYTEGVKVVALFVEKEGDEIKISFRSKSDFNVASFAREVSSDGGGHVKASGCIVPGKLQDIREKITQELLLRL